MRVPTGVARAPADACHARLTPPLFARLPRARCLPALPAEEMEKQLAKARPTQLMRYEWEARAEEVLASYQDHDIPPVPGRRPTEMDENPRRFQKRW